MRGDWREELRRFVAEQAGGFALACLGALLLFALLPSAVIPFNDDFGYYRSVLETAARGRPWTDDWLEPWSAFPSVLSAVLFKATGSFRLATQGVLLIAYAAAIYLLFQVLLEAGARSSRAGIFAVALGTTPTLLWKAVEFTGVAVTLPLLLGAILSARKQRWLLFALFWCLAISTRQSAIAWGLLALPLGGREGPHQKRQVVSFAAVAAAGLLTYSACSYGMNKTHAQLVMTGNMWHTLSFRAWAQQTLLSLGVVAVVSGLASYCHACPRSSREPRHWLVPLSAGSLALLPLSWISLEHPTLQSDLAQWYLRAAVLVGAAAWFWNDIKIRPAFALAAGAAAALASLRGALYDYYLLDAGLMACAAVFSAPSSSFSKPPEVRWVQGRRWIFAGGAATALCVHAVFVTRMKESLDTDAALVRLLETGLREHRVRPDQLSPAPFGFVGWHLYPHYIAHEGQEGGYIANFTDYVRANALYWETRSVRDAHPLQDPENILATTVAKVGWRHSHLFILRKNAAAGPAPVPLDLAGYTAERFPLTDGEWLELSRRYHLNSVAGKTNVSHTY
jgi:hypothetical protein